VFREFVLLCREIDLITGELVAVDGAFLRANASKNQLITKKSVVSNLAKIDENIDEYLNALNFSDTAEKTQQPLRPQANRLSNMSKRKAKLDQIWRCLKRWVSLNTIGPIPMQKEWLSPAIILWLTIAKLLSTASTNL
jgi:hypothetical protein